MSDPEKRVAVNAVIVKIHAITGWQIPEPAIANILVDQLNKKMQESYPTVNVDELEYAFRTYSEEVKDWGKQMNLSLIAEVMTPYLRDRAQVSKIEEQKTSMQIEHKEDLGDKAMQEWYDHTALAVKENKARLEFLPPMLYDWLFKAGKIEDHKIYHKAAAIHIGKRLAGDVLNPKEVTAFRVMYKAGVFSGKYITEIESLSKSIALNNYILKNK